MFYLQDNANLPNFICIQETWIYNNLLPKIPGYENVHTFRTRKKGGRGAIYVKSNIEFSIIEEIIFQDIDIEIAGIVFKSGKDVITLESVYIYIAPNQAVKIDHLNRLLINENTIIVGDLNAKNKLWGSPVNDFRGKLINKFVDDNNMVILNNGKGTRLNHNGSLSHLDIAFCSNNLSYKMEFDIIYL